MTCWSAQCRSLAAGQVRNGDADGHQRGGVAVEGPAAPFGA